MYAIVKDHDADVRFTFVTGVSRFSKVSPFSGLNNPTGITMDPRYSAICGCTDDDLDTVFTAELTGLDRDAIRDWYNGYSWRGDGRVYNPFDILLLFRNREFKAHWFETGSPTFLADTLLDRRVGSVALEDMIATDELLFKFDVDDMPTEALLFQTGYLTIAEERNLAGRTFYRLGYPNREVKQSFNEHLLQAGSFKPGRTRHSALRTTVGQRLRRLGIVVVPRFLCRHPLLNGTPTTTLRTTRATTRACSTHGSRRSA